MRWTRGSRTELQNSNMDRHSPQELILARTAAFRQADYGCVFDCHHADSLFRQQFPDRNEYIRFARTSLGREFRILMCRILKTKLALPETAVIYAMELEVSGRRHAYAELAWLRQEEGEWRYHRGQKLEENEWPCPLEQLDFNTFDEVAERAIF